MTDPLARVAEAARNLIDDVKRRHPGEALQCPYMIALDAALAGTGDNVLAAPTDGWIEWRGGRQPEPDDTLVHVRYRDGNESAAFEASSYSWSNYDVGSDIIAYRLATPTEGRNG